MIDGKIINFSYLDLLEKPIKYSPFIIAYFYILGFIITNAHLGNYGISNIPPIQIQYIVTGFNFNLFLFAPILMFFLPLVIANKFESLFKKIIGGFGSAILSFYILSTIMLTIIEGSAEITFLPHQTGLFFKKINLSWFILSIVVSMFTTIIFILPLVKREDIVKTAVPEFWYLLIFITYLFISSLMYYTKEIHPSINSAFAGGRPINVTICIMKEGVPIVSSLGLKPNEYNIIQDVKIIYEASSEVYISSQDKNGETHIISLPKKNYCRYRIFIKKC